MSTATWRVPLYRGHLVPVLRLSTEQQSMAPIVSGYMLICQTPPICYMFVEFDRPTLCDLCAVLTQRSVRTQYVYTSRLTLPEMYFTIMVIWILAGMKIY